MAHDLDWVRQMEQDQPADHRIEGFAVAERLGVGLDKTHVLDAAGNPALLRDAQHRRSLIGPDNGTVRPHELREQKRLDELGALPDGTSVETAADLLWLYTAPENYRTLVIERSWPAKRYRSWFRCAVGTILT